MAGGRGPARRPAGDDDFSRAAVRAGRHNRVARTRPSPASFRPARCAAAATSSPCPRSTRPTPTSRQRTGGTDPTPRPGSRSMPALGRAARNSARAMPARRSPRTAAGHRVAQHVGDIAQAGRAADHGPVEKAGPIAAVADSRVDDCRIDEQVAHVRVAVDEGARPRVPQRHDVVGAGEVDVGETVELLRELIADRVDRHLHEGRAAAGRAGALAARARRDRRPRRSGATPRTGACSAAICSTMSRARHAMSSSFGCGNRHPFATRSSSTMT